MAGAVEERLTADMKAALKAGDEGKLALSVIRLARAALQNAAIEKRRALTEEETAAVLAREVKQRREAAEEYARLGRPDAADRLRAEIGILEKYLPQQLSDDELRRVVLEAIAATGATSRRDMGKVMGKVMPVVRGRADGAKVNDIVAALLPEG